jgi:hypothetical protein
MFGIIRTSRGSPAPRGRPDVARIIPFPRPDATGPEDREGPASGSPRVRPTAGEPSPRLRIFRPKPRRSGSNLGLTASEEAELVNFLKILSDGYTKPNPPFGGD